MSKYNIKKAVIDADKKKNLSSTGSGGSVEDMYCVMTQDDIVAVYEDLTTSPGLRLVLVFTKQPVFLQNVETAHNVPFMSMALLDHTFAPAYRCPYVDVIMQALNDNILKTVEFTENIMFFGEIRTPMWCMIVNERIGMSDVATGNFVLTPKEEWPSVFGMIEKAVFPTIDVDKLIEILDQNPISAASMLSLSKKT